MSTTHERLPRLDSRTLEVFLAVAETGNVSSAAHRLGLTQPAVSRIIIARESKRILREMARRDIPRIVPWLGSELVIG